MNLLHFILVVMEVRGESDFWPSVLYLFLFLTKKTKEINHRGVAFSFPSLLIFFLTTNPGSLFAQWEVVGTAGFSSGTATYTAIAVSSTEIPYIVFSDGAHSGKATVMKWNGEEWKIVGSAGFSSGTATFSTTTTPIVINSSGTPYVAFTDGANSNKATVMEYNGASWVTVGSAGFSAGAATFITIALSSSGIPYVAYNDAGNSNKVTVMKYSGTSWAAVGSAGISPGSSKYTSIAINSSGTPYVAFRDGNNSNHVTVMKYGGTSWSTVGSAGFTSNISYNPSLGIDGSGNLYVAYQDGFLGPAMVKQYTGTSWSTYGSADFSTGETQYPTIAISDGVPYVAYQDVPADSAANVMSYEGGELGWQTLGTSDFSAGTVYSTSIAIGPSGSVYVAYEDKVNSDKATVMRLPMGDVLALTLTNFEADVINDYVHLTWATASEDNVCCFEAERAGDSLNFESIATVPSMGSPYTGYNYSLNDMVPLPGISYYRIKEMALNGSCIYSPIIAVNMPLKKLDVTLYPNPADNLLSIIIYDEYAEEGTLEIINLAGQKIYSSKVSLVSGANQLELALPCNSQGIYTVEIETGNGKISRNIMVR